MLAFLALLLSSHPIARPATADSLAGVVARLTGSDSAIVSRIAWRESEDTTLGAAAACTYAYRASWAKYGCRMVATQGRAYRLPRLIVLARGYTADVDIIKHEIAHLLLRTSGHPSAVFAAIESYRGR